MEANRFTVHEWNKLSWNFNVPPCNRERRTSRLLNHHLVSNKQLQCSMVAMWRSWLWYCKHNRETVPNGRITMFWSISTGYQPNEMSKFNSVIKYMTPTLPKTNSSPLRIDQNPKWKDRLQTIHCQMRTINFRKCSLSKSCTFYGKWFGIGL